MSSYYYFFFSTKEGKKGIKVHPNRISFHCKKNDGWIVSGAHVYVLYVLSEAGFL